ncbi:MAG: hypothetical protein ACD_3C00006G0004 [uncultured bacterium (gcode 4)]|uniref:Uncharacterized protein n=1 Tax=uncultured bacterium (gcode 4) TaxID=1234023 RepID=K2G3B6_9BACT|nr:MAG: hypothetical protein ACD_3C00006G0004 [uncultured bacterium (gcode 4)]
MREELENINWNTKWAKREKISKKLKNKQIKHSYWDKWDRNLKRQQIWLSRNLKKIIAKKTRLK